MSELNFGFWHRQTLREKAAKILRCWKNERDRLIKENEKMKEFILNCSVSHNETRYKYRAKTIIKEISR